jgi:hypothetical protein
MTVDPLRIVAAITVVAALITLGVWLCSADIDQDQGDLW